LRIHFYIKCKNSAKNKEKICTNQLHYFDLRAEQWRANLKQKPALETAIYQIFIYSGKSSSGKSGFAQ